MINPEITWKGNTPFSVTYNDQYYNESDGMNESRFVFLDHNHIPEIWSDKNRDSIHIFETGFGTGLNFLLTFKSFLESAGTGQWLHYYSVEKFPLSISDLKKAHNSFPEISHESTLLLEQYAPSRGFNRIIFNKENCTLTLIIGDVQNQIQQVIASNDASRRFHVWYLDGFNPATNTEMWNPNLFNEMKRLSAPNATFSTFTAAGFVRRFLVESGFTVNRVKGFAKKREMLSGKFTDSNFYSEFQNEPWFSIPKSQHLQKSATIIGAGLAGCAVAEALSRRGYQINLVDKESDIALGASSNKMGIFFPVLQKKPTPTSLYSFHGYNYLLRHLEILQNHNLETGFQQTGLLQIIENEKKRERFISAFNNSDFNNDDLCMVSQKEIKNIAGIETPYEGILFKKAGYLSPRDLCNANIAMVKKRDTAFNFINNYQLSNIAYIENKWHLKNQQNNQTIFTDIVIFCNSAEVKNMPQMEWLPINHFRGQLFELTANSFSKNLKMPLCGENYILPEEKKSHITGATFDQVSDLNIRPADNRKIWNSISGMIPEIANSMPEINVELMPSKVGLRSAATDHFPIIGALPDQSQFLKTFSPLRHGELHMRRTLKNNFNLENCWFPSLYTLSGLGSRGILYSQLGAELLASIINNDPLPVEKSLVNALNPARFLVRSLRKL